jgi:hypothetical protein
MLARPCRLGQCTKVASYQGYTGRPANVVRKAARDPLLTFGHSFSPEVILPFFVYHTLADMA